MTALTRSACIVLAGMLSTAAWAESSESTVSSGGIASIEKMPELIRLRIDIPASDSDINNALAKLKQKREAATKKLEDLGASGATITSEGPRVVPDPVDAARRQMRMMRGRPSMDAEDQAEAKPSKVHVSITLQAEWPIKADTPEAMLVMTHELRQKAKKIDLAGLKDEKLSEEEEEQMAELRQEMPSYSSFNNDRPTPGEPIIVYVAKITDAERTKMLADAFADAKADAAQLAAAAGKQLGEPRNISGRAYGPGEDYSRYYQQIAYGSEYYRIAQQARAMMSPDQMDKEAISIEPGPIKHRINLMVSFDLLPKGK